MDIYELCFSIIIYDYKWLTIKLNAYGIKATSCQLIRYQEYQRLFYSLAVVFCLEVHFLFSFWLTYFVWFTLRIQVFIIL